jgi:putative redox protein
MMITFPGGERVDARFDGRTVATDQDGSTPSPFELFLASIGTCAGVYVARFCKQRGIATDGLSIRQRMHVDPETRRIARIELVIDMPSGFPESYRDAVIRAAGLCAVKKHLENPPEIVVRMDA